MKDLFDNDPVFNQRHRDRKGRFATIERAMLDKSKRENTFLRLQAERYRRMAETATRVIIIKDKIIADLRSKLAKLKNQKS